MQPHMGGWHTCDGVLPGALKRSLVILLSLPQCHAALGMMPHTLASVDQSPVYRSSTLPLLRQGRPGLDFGGVLKVKIHILLYGDNS
jgi:hypothetical protein